jgi:uncharacterized membrane protein
MSRWLAVGAIVWPLAIGLAVWQRQDRPPAMWTTMLYAAASRICHQRPERSFWTGGVQWAVCARCSGLYAAAPFGAIAGLVAGRRRSLPALVVVGLAAVPTAITLGLEWSHLATVTNVARALAALPLGAAIAFVLLVTTAPRKTDRID